MTWQGAHGKTQQPCKFRCLMSSLLTSLWQGLSLFLFISQMPYLQVSATHDLRGQIPNTSVHHFIPQTITPIQELHCQALIWRQACFSLAWPSVVFARNLVFTHIFTNHYSALKQLVNSPLGNPQPPAPLPHARFSARQPSVYTSSGLALRCVSVSRPHPSRSARKECPNMKIASLPREDVRAPAHLKSVSVIARNLGRLS